MTEEHAQMHEDDGGGEPGRAHPVTIVADLATIHGGPTAATLAKLLRFVPEDARVFVERDGEGPWWKVRARWTEDRQPRSSQSPPRLKRTARGLEIDEDPE